MKLHINNADGHISTLGNVYKIDTPNGVVDIYSDESIKSTLNLIPLHWLVQVAGLTFLWDQDKCVLLDPHSSRKYILTPRNGIPRLSDDQLLEIFQRKIDPSKLATKSGRRKRHQLSLQSVEAPEGVFYADASPPKVRYHVQRIDPECDIVTYVHAIDREFVRPCGRYVYVKDDSGYRLSDDSYRLRDLRWNCFYYNIQKRQKIHTNVQVMRFPHDWQGDSVVGCFELLAPIERHVDSEAGPMPDMSGLTRAKLTCAVELENHALTHFPALATCPTCMRCKTPRQPSTKGGSSDARLGEDLVTFDLAGPFPQGYQDQRFLAVCRSVRTNRFWAAGITSKAPDTILTFLSEAIRELRLEQLRWCLHSDNEGALTSPRVLSYIALKGGYLKFGVPYEHNTNARGEAAIRRAEEAIRCLLHAAAAPLQAWPYASLCWSSCHNRDLADNSTQLRVFGTLGYGIIPSDKSQKDMPFLTKLHAKQLPVCYLGPAPQTSGGINVLYWNPTRDKYLVCTILDSNCVWTDRMAFTKGLKDLQAYHQSFIDESPAEQPPVAVDESPAEQPPHAVSAPRPAAPDLACPACAGKHRKHTCDRAKPSDPKRPSSRGGEEDHATLTDVLHSSCDNADGFCSPALLLQWKSVSSHIKDVYQKGNTKISKTLVKKLNEKHENTHTVFVSLTKSKRITSVTCQKGTLKSLSKSRSTSHVVAIVLDNETDVSTLRSNLLHIKNNAVDLAAIMLKRSNRIKSMQANLTKLTRLSNALVTTIISREEAFHTDETTTKLFKEAVAKEWNNMLRFQVFSDPLEKKYVIRNVPKACFVQAVFPLCWKHTELERSKWKPKARLCAAGNRVFNPDGMSPMIATGYGTSFSAQPASLTAVRIVCAIALLYGIFPETCDLDGAYLQSSLEERTDIPPHFLNLHKDFWPADWYNEDGSAKFNEPVVRLRRAIYGLNVSGFVWIEHCASKLIKLGWSRLKIEHSVFVRKNKQGFYDILLTYIDDIILVSTDFSKAWEELRSVFQMKDTEPIELFVGLKIDYKKYNNLKTDSAERSSTLPKRSSTFPGRSLTFHQNEYCKTVVKEFFEAYDLKPKKVQTPFVYCSGNDDGTPGRFADRIRHYVGCLLYLSRGTRVDISYAVSVLSQYTDRWHSHCDQLLFRLMCYLHTYPEGNLNASIGSNISPASLSSATIEVHGDADFAACKETRKSHAGYIVYLTADGLKYPLEWVSRKISHVTTSTAESELSALVKGTKAGIRLAELFRELTGTTPKVIVKCDASAVIAMVTSGYSQKLAHIGRTSGVSLAWCHQVFQKETLEKIDTEINTSDILTKPMDIKRHKMLCDLIGLTLGGGPN